VIDVDLLWDVLVVELPAGALSLVQNSLNLELYKSVVTICFVLDTIPSQSRQHKLHAIPINLSLLPKIAFNNGCHQNSQAHQGGAIRFKTRSSHSTMVPREGWGC